MFALIVAINVLMNPFALFVYLNPLMDELPKPVFFLVLFKAALISLAIYVIFALTGDTLFNDVFQISFQAFSIFGGIVIFVIALLFIIQGKKSFISLRENLDDVASEIALPFMVGAGSISLSIVIGNRYPAGAAVAILAVSMAINYLIIALLTFIKYKLLKRKFRVAFDKLMGIFLRINGFFVGAIGVDMIIKGIQQLSV